MSTSQAGAPIGDTDHAIRCKIRAAAAGRDEVVFDGIDAKRLRGQWRVRLHRSWVVEPGAATGNPPVPARPLGDAVSDGES